MQLGMIGLGRMGGTIVQRLLRGGHACVVFDSQPARVTLLAHHGATGSHSLEEFINALDAPRVVWLMLPAAAVETTLQRTIAAPPGRRCRRRRRQLALRRRYSARESAGGPWHSLP